MTAIVAHPRQVQAARRRRDSVQLAHVRIVLVLFVFVLAFLLVIGRLTSFGIFGLPGDNGGLSTILIPPRGDLLDRNGEPMARTIQGYAIRVVPSRLLGDKERLARQLNAIFPETSAASFLKKLRAEKSSYLRRRALPGEVRRVHALGEVGIEFPRENERLYPQGDLGAHVLGFVDSEGKGVMGMERALDARLSDPTLRGKPVILSVDVGVQAALRSELEAAMLLHSAKGAAGIVMNAQTGEVLALSSLPVFNPNKIKPMGTGPNRYDHQANAVSQGTYELGSTFKPLTIAAALDAEVVTDLALRYDATRPLNVAGFPIRDDHPQKRFLNVPETLVHSSNIVTARIADQLGTQRMQALVNRLGMHERPYIELRERGQPTLPEKWGRLANMTVAYGHGIAVTPLHLASAYAALVNGGIWRPATLLRVDGEPKAGRQVFKAATSARMRQLLRMIVVSGTGKKADAEGYRIGGKTGSADKSTKGGYAKSSVVATFAAAFPMDDPRYVIIVMLDDPQGVAETAFQRTAGWTAAPVVRKLVPRIGPMLGVYPDTHRDVDVSELTPLLWQPKG